jgi:hypothetical protein
MVFDAEKVLKNLLFFSSVTTQTRLDQCFYTFFGPRHTIRLKLIWRHPHPAKIIVSYTLSSRTIVKGLILNSVFGDTSRLNLRNILGAC